MRLLWRITLALALTLLTQIGGLAYLVSLLFKRSTLAFLALYTALSIATVFIAPATSGRTALPCIGAGDMRMATPLYCALNRHYAVPDMAALLADTGTAMAATHADTQTLILDANFPFFDGFPLLPHLSHDDGHKADIAFYYQRGGSYIRGKMKSPIGYFAFEDGPTDCPKAWPTLRWDMGWLQPLWSALGPDLGLDSARMQSLLQILAADPRTGKILLEPHLTQSLGAQHPKIRFQGCRAARHDDHIHIQL